MSFNKARKSAFINYIMNFSIGYAKETNSVLKNKEYEEMKNVMFYLFSLLKVRKNRTTN